MNKHPAPEPHQTEDSSANYANYQPPEKKRNPKWRKVALAGGVALLLIVVVGGVYWFSFKDKQSDQTSNSAETTQGGSQLAPAASEITAETKHYVSQNFRLEFDYPQDWTASEDNAEVISALSTDLALKDTANKDVVGQVYFRIRANSQKLEGLDGGNGSAVRNSEKIAYTKPTQSQRDSTYISFLRYVTSTDDKTLDAVYITGDLGYQTGQAVPKLDIEKVQPIVSLEFYLCPNSGCVEVSGVSGIGIGALENPGIWGPLTKMLKSLIIN